jgi:hypothetical protein
MLAGAATTLGYLKNYRIATIEGRFGGGKTSCAFRLAYELVQQGHARYIVSNVASVWNDDPEAVLPDDEYKRNVVIILDEAGIFLEDTRAAKKYINFLRKLNITLLMPSAETPASRVRNLVIQRTFQGQAWGLPLWKYGVSLNQGKIKENVGFDWWFPHEIYGIYDTAGAPVDDGGISYWLQRWTDEYREFHGSDSGAKRHAKSLDELGAGVSSGAGEVEELRGLVADISTEARQLADTVSVLERQGRKRGRKP